MKLKKQIFISTLLSVMLLASPVQAIENENETEDQDPGMLPELILRPVGLASTALGLGMLIASSPFAALASIPEPHDALEITYNMFAVTPIRFTFTRPLGDYRLDIDAD